MLKKYQIKKDRRTSIWDESEQKYKSGSIVFTYE